MLNLSPAVLGVVRGLGVLLLATTLSYFADASHLQGIVSPTVAAIIAAIVLGLEQHIESKTGNALFGAVKRS